MRVVLTQPLPRVQSLAGVLRAHGHEPLLMPYADIRSLLDWSGVARHLEHVSRGAIVIFVSPSAAACALQGLRGDWPDGVIAAAIGPGTAEALQALGLGHQGAPILVPAQAPYDAAALLQHPAFAESPAPEVLVLKGQGARTGWIDAARERGLSVQSLDVYASRRLQPASAAMVQLDGWALAPATFRICVTAGAALDLLDAAARTSAALLARRPTVALLTIHPKIAQAAIDRGWRETKVIAPGEQALLAAIESV